MTEPIQARLDLNQEFPELQRKLPTLWTRSKFIATVGSVSLEVVKQYIEAISVTKNEAIKATHNTTSALALGISLD